MNISIAYVAELTFELPASVLGLVRCDEFVIRYIASTGSMLKWNPGS